MSTLRLSAAAALLALAACKPAPARDAASAHGSASSNAGRAASAADDGDASTVTYRIHPGMPEYRFRAFTGAAGQVDSIAAAPADGSAPGQTLRPADNDPGGAPPLKDRLAVEDLDLDGYGDLSFGTVYASAGNARRDYWRFDPRARRFAYLGEFDALSVHPERRVLTTFNQSGAGHYWTAALYRFQNGVLTLVRQESQEAVDGDAGHLVYSVKEVRNGLPVDVSTDTIPMEKARLGPSWSLLI